MKEKANQSWREKKIHTCICIWGICKSEKASCLECVKKKKAVINCWMVTNSLYSNWPAFSLNIVTWVSSGETSRGNISRSTNHTQKSDKLLSYPVLSLSEINCYRYQRFGGVLLPGIRQLKQNFHNEKKLGKILEKAFHKRSVPKAKACETWICF